MKLLKSFQYAFEGLFYTIKTQRNMKIHCVMALLVLFAAYIFKISKTELIICFILFGLIMSLECINTALEQALDCLHPEYHMSIKHAKDCAAGAVLIASIFASIIGLIIFIPYIF